MMDASHGAAESRPAGVVVRLEKSLAAIDDGRVALLHYLAPFHLDERVVNRLEVVLEELVSNVIRHNVDAKTVTIEADYSDGEIALAVADDGSAFDPLEVTAPAPFTTLEEAKIGGLGIPLIRRLTRNLRYERIGDCNRISAVIPPA